MPRGSEFTPESFDGREREIPEDEKQSASRHFIDGVDGLFAEHEDNVFVYHFHGRRRSEFLKLNMTLPEVRYDFLATRLETRSGGSYEDQSLTVGKDNPRTTRSYPTHLYHLDESETVLRRDYNLRADVELASLYDSPAPRKQSPAEKIRSADEDRSNRDLQREMGLNDQPVRLAEVEQVISLAQQADSSEDN